MKEKELSQILDKIEELYFDSDVNNKFELLTELWTKYYQFSYSYKLDLKRSYDLYLLGENVSYILDSELNYENNLEVPNRVIDKLRYVIENNKDKLNCGLTIEEVNTFLKWIVNRVWKNLTFFGIDLSRNSLNGYCEIAQFLSIYPLESLGLNVTINTAEDSFDYMFHHAFGTVEIPINLNGIVENKVFLIDPTYKQFFTAVRCNYGRYYAKEENTGLIVAPDPGYFMRGENEKNICKQIIKNGYILLDDDVAKVYGDGFKKASISLENFDNFNKLNLYSGNYYVKKIKDTSSNYCCDRDELDGYFFDYEILNKKNHNR